MFCLCYSVRKCSGGLLAAAKCTYIESLQVLLTHCSIDFDTHYRRSSTKFPWAPIIQRGFWGGPQIHIQGSEKWGGCLLKVGPYLRNYDIMVATEPMEEYQQQRNHALWMLEVYVSAIIIHSKQTSKWWLQMQVGHSHSSQHGVSQTIIQSRIWNQ